VAGAARDVVIRNEAIWLTRPDARRVVAEASTTDDDDACRVLAVFTKPVAQLVHVHVQGLGPPLALLIALLIEQGRLPEIARVVGVLRRAAGVTG
jgi:hypothetical protein